MNDFVFNKEVTLKEQEQFVQTTKELKSLVSQAENSGISAWKAGKIFFEIKSKKIYKIQYKTFKTYIKNEFDITDQTANSYIKIFKNFGSAEIGNLLSSSLTAIADIQNPYIKQMVAEAFSNRESKSFRAKDVIATIAFIGSRDDISTEEINEIIDRVLKIIPRRPPCGGGRYGESFKKEEYKIPVYEWIEKEPINEMGVVAVFCLIFHHIRNIKFEHSKGTLTFESINYIQAAFPDINIKCKLHNKRKFSNEFIDISAEFELKSQNYLQHKHYKSTKECELIICWEDNIRNDNKDTQSDFIEKMPPILELKEFLKTGEIKLRF